MVHTDSFLHGRHVDKPVDFSFNALKIHESTEILNPCYTTIVDLVYNWLVIQLDRRWSTEVIIIIIISPVTSFSPLTVPIAMFITSAAVFAQGTPKLINIIISFAAAMHTARS